MKLDVARLPPSSKSLRKELSLQDLMQVLFIFKAWLLKDYILHNCIHFAACLWTHVIYEFIVRYGPVEYCLLVAKGDPLQVADDR